VLRAGPLSDERIVQLANRRFVSFYFDLSDRGAAGDPDARKFVVAARKELGGRAVPTPRLLFMSADGKVLGSTSNYATEDQVLAAMLQVLRENPDFNKPSKMEADEANSLAQARIAIDLQQYDKARTLLRTLDSAESYYLRGRLARLSGDWDAAESLFAKVSKDTLADDLRIERAYRHWSDANFEKLVDHLREFPKESNRYSEARYYQGLALYHLGKKDEAMKLWESTIKACSQDPWIYRADWAFTTLKQDGARGFFSTSGPKDSLLGRIGYMGRANPDLKTRSKRVESSTKEK
jgi:tetratricopeptide (TPR) repeat protein